MNEPVYAIVYARSATDNPVRIAEQGRLCRDFAGARGWTVVGEYADNGVGGFRRNIRPGLEKAMTALRAGNVLIVEDVFRLARNLLYSIEICQELCARGVRVMTLDGLDSASCVFQAFLKTVYR